MRLRLCFVILLLAAGLSQEAETEKPEIEVAGSWTFQSLIEELLNIWSLSRTTMTGRFRGVSSYQARALLYENVVDAAIPDMPATAAEALKTTDIAMYPLWGVALTPVYNIPELGNIHLVFSGSVLARIFQGNITHWDHPELKALNPDVPLPAQPIACLNAPGGVRGSTAVLTAFFSSVDENFRRKVGVVNQLNWKETFPDAPFVIVEDATAVTALLMSTKYCLAIRTVAEAESMGLTYGYMMNKAGQVVEPTERAVTSSMIETGSAGVTFDGRPLISVDGGGRDSWPLTIWTYLLLRKEEYRATCAIKRAVVDFALWLYSSEVAHKTAINYGVVILPDALDTTLGVSASLTKDILCDGTPVVTTTSQADIRAVSTQMDHMPLRGLLAAFQDSSVVSTSYQVSVNTGERALRRVSLQEIDLAVVVLSTLGMERLQMVVSGNLIALPIWSQSLAIVHSLPVPDGYELRMDIDTLARIWNGEIKRWDHQDIARFNPELHQMGVLNYSVTYVVRTQNTDLEKLFVRAIAGASTTFGLDSNAIYNSPSIRELPIYDRLQPSIEIISEATIPDHVSITPGAIAVMSYFDALTQLEGRKTKVMTLLNRDGKPIYPSEESRRACETDTYNPVYNTYAFYRSSNPDCYPLAAVSNIVIQRSHTGDCTKIRRSLQFAKQIFSSKMSLDRFQMSWANDQDVRKNLDFLNTVTCNGEPVLVLLPEHNKVPKPVTDGSRALAVILVIVCALSIVFTWSYRRRKAFKASSPVFMILTLFGIAILSTSGFVLPVETPTDATCSAASWLLVLGLYLSFAPLFAKVWRIYRIFFRAEMQIIRLPDWKLLIYVAIPLAAVLTLLSVVQAVDPLRPFVFRKQRGEGVRDLMYDYCGTGEAGVVIGIILGAGLAAMILFGAIMAFSTRSVVHTFNESKTQAFAIYNMLMTAILVVAVSVLTADGPTITILISFASLWVAGVTWVTVFMPRAYEIWATATSFLPDRESASKSGSTSGTASLSTQNPKTVKELASVGIRHMDKNMVRLYLALLEKEMALARVHLTQLLLHEGDVNEAAIKELQLGFSDAGKRNSGNFNSVVSKRGVTTMAPTPTAGNRRTAAATPSHAHPTISTTISEEEIEAQIRRLQNPGQRQPTTPANITSTTTTPGPTHAPLSVRAPSVTPEPTSLVSSNLAPQPHRPPELQISQGPDIFSPSAGASQYA